MPPAKKATRAAARTGRRSASAERSKPTEIGASGLQVAGGRVIEEFLPLLRNERGIRMWREMGDNDPYSGALLYGVLQTVLRCDWTIDLNEAPVADGDFLEQCRDDMCHPWRDVVAEALTCAQFGWALLEPVMKWRLGPEAVDEDSASDYDDGRLGWQKMPLRAQETLYQWIWNPEAGEAIAMRQRLIASDVIRDGGTYVDIPLDAALLFRTTHHKNNPEGRSLLRSGWTAYDKRKKIETYEGIGIERDMAGIPVFYVPAALMSPDAPADMKAALAEFHRIGNNLRIDDQSHLVMPSEFDENGNQLYDFELASTNARRSIDTNTVITRLAVAQLMSIMADVMMVGHESNGSRALASVKDDAFTAGLQTLLDEVRDVVNKSAVPRLFRVNGIAPPWPKFATAPVQRVDPAEFCNMVLHLAQSGMPLWPDDPLDGYIRELLGWPERDESQPGMALNDGGEDDEQVVEPGATPTPRDGPSGSGMGRGAAAADKGAEMARQETTDTPKRVRAKPQRVGQ